MTIRRDLHSLQATEEVRLVHGGASLTPGALHGPVFGDDEQAGPRDRLGRHAAGLLGLTDTIAIDAGPTAYAIARSLPRDFVGCVITQSMPVLQLLADRPAVRVVALGGELLADRRALVGPTTEAALAELRVRTFFFSPSGDRCAGNLLGLGRGGERPAQTDGHRGPGGPRRHVRGVLHLRPGAGRSAVPLARLGGRPMPAGGARRRPEPGGRRLATYVARRHTRGQEPPNQPTGHPVPDARRAWDGDDPLSGGSRPHRVVSGGVDMT